MILKPMPPKRLPKHVLKDLLEILFPGAIFKQPSGITPDPTGLFGLQAVINNVNNYCEAPFTVPSSQAVANVVTLTAFQATIGEIIIPALGGISAAFVIQLPSTASIIAQLGANVIPLDGSYAEPMHVSNSSGQTGTLTAGDGSTTISGTATVATGATRKWLLTVPAAVNPGVATISIVNMGSWTYP